MNKVFPFEFIRLPFSSDNNVSPFIKTVEGILNTNLQDKNTFGCKIMNCHTHAGSKIHFDNFIEAELLFHNNYYNQGFAILTV